MALGATELGVAYLTILPSLQGFNRKIDAEAGRAGTSAGGKFGSHFKKVAGAAIITGVALIARKAVQIIGDAIAGASALAETQSKVNVIFGKDSSKALQTWSKNSAKAFGQSQGDALQAAANFAIFGKSAGLTGKDLTKFSTGFVELASDFASFHDTTPEEAIVAIGAALRGENEPIRRYGILLDDASLRQEALRLGITKTTKNALTPQQKVLAAQSLIYKQSKDAQGDFARTSEGLANQQRYLNAQIKNGKDALGTAFLPIVTKVVKFLDDKFIPVIVDDVIPAVQDFFKQIRSDPALKTAWDNLVAAISGLIKVDAAGFLDSVATSLPPIVQGIADLVNNYKKFSDFIDKFEKRSFEPGDAVGGIVGQFVKDFKAGGTIEQALIEFRVWAPARVREAWTDIKAGFVGNQGVINTITGGWVTRMVGRFVDLKDRAKARTKEGLQSIKDSWNLRTGEVAAKVGSWRTRVVGFFSDLSGRTKSRTSEMLQSIKNSWYQRTGEVAAKVGGWRDKLLGIGRDLKTRLYSSMSTLLTDLRDRFNRGVDAIGVAWDRLKAKAKAPIAFIVDTVYTKGLKPAFDTIAKALNVPELPKVTLKWAKGTSQVLPGYTPGRDVHRSSSPTGGFLDLSGGEGIARPEIVRAVGKRRWMAAQTAAARGHTSDALEYLNAGRRRNLGSFAQGGVTGGLAGAIAYGRSLGIRNIGTYPGHHPSMALARDFMTSSAAKHAQLSSGLWANRKLFRLWYIISRRRIISMTRPGAGWRPYTRSNPHTDHVHASFYPAALSKIFGVLSKGGDIIAPLIDYVQQLKDKFKGPLDQIEGMGTWPWAEVVKASGNKLADGMIEKIKSAAEAVATAGNEFSGIGGGGSNRTIGKRMMLERWPITQWPALNSLWTKESNWRTQAKNPSSGAYGIPQALPGSKMASAGANWRTSAATQIKWGLGYIAGRYGTPSKAWAHSINTNWYGNGGVISEPVIGLGLRSGSSYGFGEKGKELVTPLAGNMGASERPLTLILDLGDAIEYRIQGVIDDNDEFRAQVGRTRRG